jgi:hypothetical protein
MNNDLTEKIAPRDDCMSCGWLHKGVSDLESDVKILKSHERGVSLKTFITVSLVIAGALASILISQYTFQTNILSVLGEVKTRVAVMQTQLPPPKNFIAP